MKFTIDTMKEHDLEVANLLDSSWDINCVAMIGDSRRAIDLETAAVLIGNNCAILIVSGSIEHKIALVRCFISEAVLLIANGTTYPATPEHFDMWLQARSEASQ